MNLILDRRASAALQDVPALCALLTKATSFTELDLGYNRIGDEGCVALQKFLEVCDQTARRF
jgi:hypothetical protein